MLDTQSNRVLQALVLVASNQDISISTSDPVAATAIASTHISMRAVPPKLNQSAIAPMVQNLVLCTSAPSSSPSSSPPQTTAITAALGSSGRVIAVSRSYERDGPNVSQQEGTKGLS